MLMVGNKSDLEAQRVVSILYILKSTKHFSGFCI